ncbi:hypothetical protein BAUCODRAFT_36564 [Baudoinia panamericana UAMH 10762]|uniref:Uncharacterized protein n=1 Tax=Baudoinia panamericana (strain UAMH 10762) TaxID=717646 RepID=M2LIS5_BAUPA|nr:uncharacterized protein BAUCODRAFT_36564 [Baudoinia panamericana UAMH 10762]EMC94092.1 hypothetical protein BAUCODRAFT_36564 [Baudoinia panamericana UAMH 10762]
MADTTISTFTSNDSYEGSFSGGCTPSIAGPAVRSVLLAMRAPYAQECRWNNGT